MLDGTIAPEELLLPLSGSLLLPWRWRRQWF